MVLFILLLVWCVFGALGYYISDQKGRAPIEGALLGFLFGPLGALIAALLPTVEQSKRPRRGRDRVAWMPDYRDDWDEPVVESSDGMDDQALAFLNEPSPPKPQPTVDVDAIGQLEPRVVEKTIEDLGAQAAEDDQRRGSASRRGEIWGVDLSCLQSTTRSTAAAAGDGRVG